MSTTSVEPVGTSDAVTQRTPNEMSRAQRVIAWSSLLFVLLQSVCTFFTALDGLRVVIGVSALASVVQAGEVWDKFHADRVRVPMMALALLGALLNLVMLRRIRRLRDRPAAQWRRQPLPARKIRMERVQFALSLLTLALVVVEEITHWRTFHRL